MGHQVVLLVEDVVTVAREVGPLDVGVDIHLDNTVLDGGGDLLLAGAGTTVEDQEERLLVLAVVLLAGVLLVLTEDGWGELDVTWLVDTVDVTEGSSNAE